MKIKAVLFDFDGVICDSKKTHTNSWRHAIDEILNGEHSVFSEEELSGKSAELIAKTISARYNQIDRWEAVLKSKNTYISDHIDTMKPLIGVKEMFNLLSDKKIPFGIASNASKFYVQQCIANWGFEVSKCYGYEDYKFAKPNPEPYLKLAQHLGISIGDHHKVLVFEDSEPGLLAAIAAGMQSAHIKSHCLVSATTRDKTDYAFKSVYDAKDLFS